MCFASTADHTAPFSEKAKHLTEVDTKRGKNGITEEYGNHMRGNGTLAKMAFGSYRKKMPENVTENSRVISCQQPNGETKTSEGRGDIPRLSL